MNRKRIYKNQLPAMLLLAVFIYMQGNQLLCNVSHIIDKIYSTTAHIHPFGHDHHHGTELPEAGHTDEGLPDHDENKCCNAYAQHFFLTISKAPVSVTKISFDFCTWTAFVLAPVTVIPYSPCNQFVFHKAQFVPPPKIPDIRVFIGSFQV